MTFNPIREILARILTPDFPNDRCVLCLKDNIENRAASGCCERCDCFAELLAKDNAFGFKVVEILTYLQSFGPQDDTRIVIKDCGDTFTHSILIPYASVLSNPLKLLFYACQITMFFRIRENYRNDKTKAFQIHPDLAVRISNSLGAEMLVTASSCYSTLIQASLQVPVGHEITPDFWLIDDEVEALFYHSFTGPTSSLFASCEAIIQACGDKVNSLQVRTSIGRDTKTGLIKGEFALTDYEMRVSAAIVQKARTAGLPFYLMNDVGRCSTVLHPSFAEPIVVVDALWLEKQQQKQAKAAKKEQQRKEQELKEKQERQREEQRQLAIKHRENALRTARATLVTAVAKIDADLERINRLKEINREVALKNRKIFERKEAEKLAAAAAARHAEKLKQKEIERQKFISKKN